MNFKYGMIAEAYFAILDKLTEWRITTSQAVCPREYKKDVVRHDPIRGYPVVLSYKPNPKTCDWCEDQCQRGKTYSRSIGSQLWHARCQDCGEIRKISTSEVNSNK